MPLVATRSAASAFGLGWSNFAAGGTDAYTTIDSIAVTSSVSSVTFSSIPQDYTDLVITYRMINGSGSNHVQLRINGDTSSVYPSTIITEYNASLYSTQINQNSAVYLSWYAYPPSSAVLAGQLQFNAYTQTDLYKKVQNKLGGSNGSTRTFWYTGGSRRSTEAITSIQILNGNSISAGSKFNLYGITRTEA